jgi:hypothetical protein
MNNYFSNVLLVSVVGLLASCASTTRSAATSPPATSTQQALAGQPQTDAVLRAGLPVSQVDARTAQACALIPEAEQNVCPLQHTLVLGTRQLKTPIDTKGYVFAPAGAVVYMVAAPGLTQEWLGHLVECYQAKVAMAGTALQARESCPLAEPESSYSVSSTGDGFAISIRSARYDYDAAKRIIEGSERLAPSNSPHHDSLAVSP